MLQIAGVTRTVGRIFDLASTRHTISARAPGLPYWTLDIGAYFVKQDPELWSWCGDYDKGVEDLGCPLDFSARQTDAGVIFPKHASSVFVGQHRRGIIPLSSNSALDGRLASLKDNSDRTREGHPFQWLHGPLKDPYKVTEKVENF